MSAFYEALLPGFEHRCFITRNALHASDLCINRHSQFAWDWKMQVETPYFNPLDVSRFDDGDEINLESFDDEVDYVFRATKDGWVEVSRLPW